MHHSDEADSIGPIILSGLKYNFDGTISSAWGDFLKVSFERHHMLRYEGYKNLLCANTELVLW